MTGLVEFIDIDRIGRLAEIAAEDEYVLVVPDFIYGGGDGYEIPQDRFASRPASELKYLVLDAILRAQAEGLAIGEPVDAGNPRYVQVGPSREECWAEAN